MPVTQQELDAEWDAAPSPDLKAAVDAEWDAAPAPDAGPRVAVAPVEAGSPQGFAPAQEAVGPSAMERFDSMVQQGKDLWNRGQQEMQTWNRDVPEPSVAEEAMSAGVPLLAPTIKALQQKVIAPAATAAQDTVGRQAINGLMYTAHAARDVGTASRLVGQDLAGDYGTDGTKVKQTAYDALDWLRARYQTGAWAEREKNEWLMREALSPIGGDSVKLNAVRDPETKQWHLDPNDLKLQAALADVAPLADIHPELPGLLPAAARLVGETPMYMLLGRIGLGADVSAAVGRYMPSAAVPAETFLQGMGRLIQRATITGVGGAVEGGVFGAAQATANQGSDYGENALGGVAAGGVLGATLPHVMEGVAKVLPKPGEFKAAFQLYPEAMSKFQELALRVVKNDQVAKLEREAAIPLKLRTKVHIARGMAEGTGDVAMRGDVGLMDEGKPSYTVDGQKVQQPAYDFVSERKEKLKYPSAFGLMKNKDGKLVGRAVQTMVPTKENPLGHWVYHDTELPSDDALGRWIQRYDVRLHELSLHPDFFETPGQPGQFDQAMWERAQLAVEQSYSRGMSQRKFNEGGAKNERFRAFEGKSEAPYDVPEESLSEALDRVREEIKAERAKSGGGPVVMGVQDGAVVAKPALAPEPVRAPQGEVKRGDKVTIHQPTGEKYAGVVESALPDGRYRVRLAPKREGGVSQGAITVSREAFSPGFQPEATAQVAAALHAVRTPKAPGLDPINAQKNFGKSFNKLLDARASMMEAEDKAKEFFGVLRPQDLQNFLGHTPEQAVQAIQRFVDEGAPYVEGAVLHEPAWKAKLAPGKEGMYVYFGKPTDENGIQVGVYRGADPKIPGNHLIDLADPAAGSFAAPTLSPPAHIANKSIQISVPRTEFNDARPVHLADELIAKPPKTWGLNKPIPSNVVLIHDPEAITAAVSMGRNIDKNISRLGFKALGKAAAAIRDAFQTKALVGPSALHGPKFTLYSSPATEAEARQVATDALKKATGLSEYSEAAKALEPIQRLRSTLLPGEKLSLRDAATEAWVKTHLPDAKDGAQLAADMMNATKNEQQRIVGLTGGADLGPDVGKLEFERALGNHDEYQRQVYNYFKLREDWLRHVQKNTPEVWQRAIDFLSAQRKSRGQAYTTSQVVEDLKRVLHESGTSAPDLGRIVNSMKGLGILDTKAANSLLAKKVIPPELLALYGPETSGLISIPDTWARAKAVGDRLEAWSQVAQSDFWSRGPREDLPIQVPMEAQYGQAAGGWVGPEWADFLKPQKVDAAQNWFQQILFGTPGRIWKRNVTVLGGPGVWLNNIMRNVKGTMLAGMDPMNMEANADAFIEAARQFRAWHANPTEFGKGGLVAEAMRFGAVSPGFGKTELTLKQQLMNNKILEQFQKKGSLESALSAVKDLVMNADEGITGAYDSIDRMFKLASYISRRRTNLANGMNIHDAAAEAALRVKQSFPDFSTMSKFVDTLRQKGFGTLAPFLSSKMEDFRINGTAVARLAQGERDLQGRVAKTMVLMGGVYGLKKAAQYADGVSDDMVEREWAKMPQSVRAMHKAPMFLSHDIKGRMVFADVTPYEDLLMSIKGSPVDSLPMRFAQSTTMDFLGDRSFQGMAANAAFTLGGSETARAQLGQTLQGMPKPGQESVAQTLQYLAKEAALLPQAPYRMDNALQLGGIGRSPYDVREILTPTETAAKALGVNIDVSGPGQDYKAAQEFKGKVKDYQGAMRSLGKDSKGDVEDATRRANGSVDRFQRQAADVSKGRQ